MQPVVPMQASVGKWKVSCPPCWLSLASMGAFQGGGENQDLAVTPECGPDLGCYGQLKTYACYFAGTSLSSSIEMPVAYHGVRG